MWLISKDCKSRSFILINSHNFNVFMLEDKIQNHVSSCSGFLSEAMLWIKEVEIVESVDDLRVIALNSRFYSFHPNFEMLDEDCVCFEQDHPEFLLQDKGQSGGTEGSE